MTVVSEGLHNEECGFVPTRLIPAGWWVRIGGDLRGCEALRRVATSKHSCWSSALSSDNPLSSSHESISR